MPIENEISSTEKLLNTIRGNEQISLKPPLPPAKTNPHVRKQQRTSSVGMGKISIGVDIGIDELRLVRVKHSQSPIVTNYISIPFEPSLRGKLPEFTEFLQKELEQFCSQTKKYELWALKSPLDVDIHHIVIPKVPPKEISNAVYWTAKKESPFNDEMSIFDYEILEEVVDQGIKKYSALIYVAEKRKVEDLRYLFQNCGFQLDGITLPSFAIQNLFKQKWLPDPEKTSAHLHIGAALSGIDIYKNGKLVFTRGIKTGANSMVESLMREYNESLQGQSNPLDINRAQKLLFGHLKYMPVRQDEPLEFQMKEEEIVAMILPAVDRLIRQVERTFDYYTITLKKEKVNRIYTSGYVAAYQPVVNYMWVQLGVRKEMVSPLDPTVHYGKDVLAPEHINDRVNMARVAGLGLAQKSTTLNALYTYKDKKRQAIINKINKSITIAFITVAISITGVSLGFDWLIQNEQNKLNVLNSELDKFQPKLNQTGILQLAIKAKNNTTAAKEVSKKYFSIAVMSEVTNLTPQNIKLMNVTVDFQSDKKSNGTLRVEGFVIEGELNPDSSLIAYMIKISGSPIFDEPIVKKRDQLYSKEYGEVLQFVFKIPVKGA